ncbi:hypothetical protein [Dysosmobacter sp. Sow4_B12]|uniref:hypothetical protein n=1 Tax=Dysosmobacter sp. Sow4_B12 TaxID=3438777 RepID=UPI003F908C87
MGNGRSVGDHAVTEVGESSSLLKADKNTSTGYAGGCVFAFAAGGLFPQELL